MALDTKRTASGQSWLTVAHQLGYFDQMHMFRDFQQLGGDVPSEIFQQIGDIQPWSLAPPANPSDFSDPAKDAALKNGPDEARIRNCHLLNGLYIPGDLVVDGQFGSYPVMPTFSATSSFSLPSERDFS